jgi:hypothetical protein
MRRTGLVVLWSLVIVGPTHGQADMKVQIPSEVYTRPAELFAVDGQRHINMYCIGSGTLTVVFISGAWENTMSWRRVQGPTSRPSSCLQLR